MSKVLIAHTQRGKLVERIAPIVTLECLQNAVGGHITAAPFYDLEKFNIYAMVNEDGLLTGLDLNQNLFPFFYVGNVAFVSADEKGFIGLTDEQIADVKAWLSDLNEEFEGGIYGKQR